MISEREILKALARKGSRVVSCPENPIAIPGIGAAAAYVAGDCLGTLTKVAVPKYGVIYSATFWDMDDEGTQAQVDLEVFKGSITQIADNAAWDPSDVNMLLFVVELAFVSFDDHISSQTSQLTNIGKGYTAPQGYLWIQAITRSTPTIADGAWPRFQIDIITDDPEWQE